MADGGTPGAVVFTASGSLVIPSGVTEMIVEAWGGGGGGAVYQVCNLLNPIGTYEAFGGGGGGAGGYVRALLGVTAGQTYTIVVGSPGSAGSINLPLNGGDGTSTSVSLGGTALVTANGGSGAPVVNNGVPQMTCPSTYGAGGAGGSVAVGGGAVVIDESTANGGSSQVPTVNGSSAGAAGGNAGEAGGGGHGETNGRTDETAGNPGLVVVTFAL